MTQFTSLAEVMPAVAAALGVPMATSPVTTAQTAAPTLPPARVVVVLLVDGLGHQLLSECGGHAPFLRSLAAAPQAAVISCGFPSTTATSMGMVGTGLLPGAHGLVGLEVLDPDRDVLFNELQWDPEVDPRRWQPLPTVFEQVAAAGQEVVRIGPGYFDGSGLTEAVQRGGRFVAARSLSERVQAALSAVRAMSAGLVYVYWGEVDKTGHEHGCTSWAWIEELEQVDAFAQRLAEGLPRDATLVITADHGMVDVPEDRRIDIAHDSELIAGVRHVGGEARAVQLYCEPGAVADVAAAWRARLGVDLDVYTRAEAVAAGLFGPVSAHVLPRIGDVVTSARSDLAVFDTRTASARLLALRGLHGAATAAETQVPLLVTPGLARALPGR